MCACVCFITKPEKLNIKCNLMPINIYKYLRLHFAAQQEVASRPAMRSGSSFCLKEAVRKLKYDFFQTIKKKRYRENMMTAVLVRIVYGLSNLQIPA